MESADYMRLALAEAEKAKKMGEVPIGAIVVKEEKVIGRGHNLRETTQNAVMHAEIVAIQEACRYLKTWRLSGTTLYVTLEPCPMCSGAILLSRIEKIYYGAKDPKAGTAGTLMNLLQDERFNHYSEVEGGLLKQEASSILTDFFKDLRGRTNTR